MICITFSILFFMVITVGAEEPLGQPGRWVTAYVRAYSAFDEIDSGHRFNDGKTAPPSNINLKTTTDPNEMYGFACDPSHLPHGTRIYVPGYWERLQSNKVTIPSKMTEVNDTCGGIGKRIQRKYEGVAYYIEVRFRGERAARRWGVNNGQSEGTFMQVYIYD